MLLCIVCVLCVCVELGVGTRWVLMLSSMSSSNVGMPKLENEFTSLVPSKDEFLDTDDIDIGSKGGLHL